MLNAITEITIMTTTCFVPATYEPAPIFPAASPPKTASIIAMLNNADSNFSISMLAREPNNPSVPLPEASRPS